jgi:hypothetical protein
MMTQLERIQDEIEALSHKDYVRLRKWFAEKDWEEWDKQIETDANAGRLDFLVEEAMAEKAKGNLKEL